LDKSPAWIAWAVEQAVKSGTDNVVLVDEKTEAKVSDSQKLSRMGIGSRR